MKSYTDLEQSKKLAKILPIESADMRYGYIAPYDYSDRMYDGGYDEVPYPKDFLKKNPDFSENEYDGELPCWSLASLLDILPYPSLAQHASGLWSLVAWVDKVEAYSVGDSVCGYDNEIDACVAMIEKLHEEKLL